MNRVKHSRAAGPVRFILNYLLKGWPEWVGALLLLFTLGIAINSIQQARWISPQPSLLTVLVLSMALAFMVSKSRLRKVDLILVGFTAGLMVTVWQITSILPSQAEGSIFNRLFNTLFSIWETLIRSTPDTGTIYFALFLIVITWLLGYILIWRFIRNHSVWPAVFLGLIVLLVNLDFLSQNYYWYFFFYLFAAILLLSFTGFLKYYSSFRQNHIRYPFQGVIWFIVSVVCLSALLIGVTWTAPEIRANQIQSITDARIQVGKTLNSARLNLFAPVKAKGAIIKTVDQSKLYFSSPPNLSRDIQFTVVSPRAPTYWRVRRYDIYSATGWSTSPAQENVVESGFPDRAKATAAPGNTLSYTVINKLKSDVVLTAGQFLAADNALLRHSFAGTEGVSSQAEDETIFFSTPRIYKPEEGYSITISEVKFSPAQLTAAGDQYPAWITSRYLQIPAELPRLVQRLSQNITRRAQTPYDKVLAVRNYLSQLKYDEKGTSPPPGSDAVDDFLTMQQTGNCTNFATAAVVLLRSAGVPARFCTGYVPHTWDQKNSTFYIEARDYHAWPEVYFPGYGWVEFEVTPGGTAELIAPESDFTSSGSGTTYPELYYYEEGYIPLDGGDNNTSAVFTENNWFSPVLTIIVVLLLLALSLEFIMRAWYRKFHRADYTAETYAKLYFAASLMKLAGSTGQTPQEFADNLAGFIPEEKKAINNITRLYAEYRYGGSTLNDLKSKQELRHAWLRISLTMLKRRISRLFAGLTL